MNCLNIRSKPRSCSSEFPCPPVSPRPMCWSSERSRLDVATLMATGQGEITKWLLSSGSQGSLSPDLGRAGRVRCQQIQQVLDGSVSVTAWRQYRSFPSSYYVSS
ncbi:hypothetical protein RRG08_052672 [Elysia crispata]|uniref:Uncharacterized protein n=1 Tax=Elysia crispata TaxID=231223 RepID=A0AAE1AQ45_9GAST|nr:hypothetical protein RRG08_052672 [Elysia crispata]